MLARVLMTLDHIGYYWGGMRPVPAWFQMTGRLYVLGAMMRLLSDYISLMFSYYTKIPILMNGIFQMFFLISWEIVWADKAKEER